jgi:voltage-gated potassium channel
VESLARGRGYGFAAMSRSIAPPVPPAKRRNPLARAWHRFITDPSSGRNAILRIVTANLATVLIGGTIIWLVDRTEFDHLGVAFWYILQTVTTVGYGDVTPKDPSGRLIGAIVMLLGLAFMSILTALITSSFVEARQAKRIAQDDVDEGARWAHLDARLDEVIQRLDGLQGREPPSS